MKQRSNQKVKKEMNSAVGQTQKTMPEAEYLPMNVFLFDKGGNMEQVHLPAQREGLYRLSLYPDQKAFDIVIKGRDNCWLASLTEDSYFVSGNSENEKTIEIRDRHFAFINNGEKRIAVYAENIHPGDNIYLHYFLNKKKEIIIGRDGSCDICYNHGCVSRKHAKLVFQEGRWHIYDLESANGVFLNEKSIRHGVLSSGDVVNIMGLSIIMGNGFAAMNNYNKRVSINPYSVREIAKGDRFNYAPFTKKTVLEEDTYDRKPRRRFMMDDVEIEIETPPMSANGNSLQAMLRMGNPVLSGSRAIMSGNVFSALSSMVMPVLLQGFNEKDRREYEEKRNRLYSQYLQVMLFRIDKEKEKEAEELNGTYPVLQEVLHFSMENKDRLWERRKYDEDFLKVRIGTGNIPMIAKKQYQARKFDIDQDTLVDKMYEIADRKEFLKDAPVLLSLKENCVIGVKGEEAERFRILKNIILQLVLTHSYDELKIIMVVSEDEAKEFDFVRYLQHNWSDDRSSRFFAVSKSEVQIISKLLNNLVEDIGDKIGETLKKRPAYVVFVTDRELYESMEVLKDLSGFSEYMGISLIACFDNLPNDCSKLIDADHVSSLIDLFNRQEDDQSFVLENASKDLQSRCLQSLMNTRLKMESAQYSLPGSVTFLEMYNAGRVEHLNPLSRWSENNPVKSLSAPIGIGTDGNKFYLDLHEKYQGPHGLIAGGTGSGKSEFIITYILSMAVNYSPDEVAFILIDYKGGGLADAFVDESRGLRLPHVVGTITNLDGAAISRSLMSINSELKRRQSVFKEAKSMTNEGTMDIYDYQKLYRSGKVPQPMPHLFIISDEFAELKKQQPEFMDELISIARIGRSLGVHLILATQKPTGVVNDQIWSNTKFRVCLRVADKSDSMEMLKRPEAAEIKNTGRFYLQVGYNELFAAGQSAWCGAPYVPEDTIVHEKDDSVRFVDNTGQVLASVRPKKENQVSLGKQIVSIVKYLSDLAVRENIHPEKLWKEPLQDLIDYDSLPEVPKKKGDVNVLLGMVDEPEKQRQFPMVFDLTNIRNMLICGPGGSGKSTLLRTLLWSVSHNYTTEEVVYYLMDMSGGVLSCFAGYPFCGSYLTENNEADFDRLLSFIRDIIDDRKKLFSENDVSSYDAYVKIAPLPLVLVVLDGYANINNFRKGTEYHANLYEYLRDGSSYGIRYIITCNHFNEVHSRSRQETDYRIALMPKDKYDSTEILGIKCNVTSAAKPGRCMAVIEEVPLEFQCAVPFAKEDEQERSRKIKAEKSAVETISGSILPGYLLPMADGEESYESFYAGFAANRIPLGYSLKDMKKVAVPFKQLHSLSVYFGNPNGVIPVWENLLYAACRNGMKLFIMKSNTDSCFNESDGRSLLGKCPADTTVVLPDIDGLKKLKEILVQVISARNILRDQFCEENRIPKTDPKRVLKAESYIRENTEPVMFVFERFADICSLGNSEELEDLEGFYQVMFEKTKGYNLFFAAGFYTEDELNDSAGFFKAFNRSGLAMLFGGNYDKQSIITPVPAELRRMDKVEKAYDRFFLRYRGELHAMRMPCGVLRMESEDPDDEAIV